MEQTSNIFIYTLTVPVLVPCLSCPRYDLFARSPDEIGGFCSACEEKGLSDISTSSIGGLRLVSAPRTRPSQYIDNDITAAVHPTFTRVVNLSHLARSSILVH